MALNVGESHAVFRLLDWICGTPPPGGGKVTSQQAMEWAATLADRARASLGAGPSGDDIRAAWPADVDEPPSDTDEDVAVLGLCGQDIKLLKVWEEHGVPDDRPTRDYLATDLLPRLWADHQALGEMVAKLAEGGDR